MIPGTPLVDFVVIGAMKAMTTSVLTTLGRHPGIATSAIKETQYFVAETGWRRGPEWYASLWSHAEPGQLRGEASPQYTFFPHFTGVPERLHATAPHAKIVYLVRDPVDRSLSHYRHAVGRGVETRPLREALLTDARYLAPSLYAMQLDQWYRVVPEDHVLVVDAAQLAADPGDWLARICRHVGADVALAPTELAKENTADQVGQLRPLVARMHRNGRWRRAGNAVRRRAPDGLVRAWDRASVVPNPPPAVEDDLRDVLRELTGRDAARLGRAMGDAAPAWAR